MWFCRWGKDAKSLASRPVEPSPSVSRTEELQPPHSWTIEYNWDNRDNWDILRSLVQPLWWTETFCHCQCLNTSVMFEQNGTVWSPVSNQNHRRSFWPALKLWALKQLNHQFSSLPPRCLLLVDTHGYLWILMDLWRRNDLLLSQRGNCLGLLLGVKAVFSRCNTMEFLSETSRQAQRTSLKRHSRFCIIL